MPAHRLKSITYAFIAIFLLIWILSQTINTSHHSIRHSLRWSGNFFGVAGYLFISLSFLLSSRWKKLEDWAGNGLDQIYIVHHQLGIWGCVFSFLHPLLLASRWLPNNYEKFFTYILPLHGRLSVNLGSISLLLLIALIVATLLKWMPYNYWKSTHKLMSFSFILASLHIILLGPRLNSAYLLLFLPMALGLFGIFFKQILPLFRTYPVFEVVGRQVINENIVQLFLKTKGKFQFVPGQYVFCKFQSDRLSTESHPFTLCGSPDGDILSIIIKARGDFTRSVYRFAQEGDQIQVEGPFGKFDFTHAGRSQIWIAGGIGIVPFIAWSRLFNSIAIDLKSVHLFYCFHRKEDAVFKAELERIGAKNPFFHIHTFCSEENGHLNLEKIQSLAGGLAEKKILMCGPKKLTKYFFNQFLQVGIDRDNIIFEDFEFF